MSLALSSFRQLEHYYERAATARPERDERVMHWSGAHLSIAGVPLLVGAGELEAIIEIPAVTQIPGTKPWVMGLAAYKGGLLPIYSGDVLFRRKPYTGRVRDHCMVVNKQGLHFGLTLSGVHGYMKLPIEERDMAHDIDPDFADFCLGGFKFEQQFLAVLDVDRLATDGELSSASVTADTSGEDKNS
ncbi:MAG: chemotaxis protein CheW [Parahaliea sp.]